MTSHQPNIVILKMVNGLSRIEEDGKLVGLITKKDEQRYLVEMFRAISYTVSGDFNSAVAFVRGVEQARRAL